MRAKNPLRLITLLVLAGTLGACRGEKQADKPAAPAPTTPAASAPAAPAAPAAPLAAQRSKQQAMDALMALPELKAWTARIEKNSGGKARAALVEDDLSPRTVEGRQYWQFSFVENTSEAMHRWESFLVAQAGDDILVEDFETDELLTLEQWRKDKQPMARESAL